MQQGGWKVGTLESEQSKEESRSYWEVGKRKGGCPILEHGAVAHEEALCKAQKGLSAGLEG